MKKLYSLLIMILTIVTSFAQPIINSTDLNPYIGLAVNYYTFTPFPFDGGPSGANVTWDFSGVSPNDSVFANYVNPASTIHGANFPTSTIASQIVGTGFEYLNANSNFMARVGIDANGIMMPYTDEEKIITYPATYNTTFTDSFVASFTSSIVFYRRGTVTMTADAWGTLILPWGSVSNVLRVHLIENYKDSSQFTNNNFVSDNYYWVTPGTHFFLCSIATVGSNYSGSYLNASSVGVNSIDFSKFLHVSPNPASNFLNIEFAANEKVLRTTITDIAGKVVYADAAGSSMEKQQINIAHLSSGYYLVNIETSERTFTQKFIRE